MGNRVAILISPQTFNVSALLVFFFVCCYFLRISCSSNTAKNAKKITKNYYNEVFCFSNALFNFEILSVLL